MDPFKWISVETLPEPQDSPTDREWYLVTDGVLYNVAFLLSGKLVGHKLEVTH